MSYESGRITVDWRCIGREGRDRSTCSHLGEADIKVNHHHSRVSEQTTDKCRSQSPRYQMTPSPPERPRENPHPHMREAPAPI